MSRAGSEVLQVGESGSGEEAGRGRLSVGGWRRKSVGLSVPCDGDGLELWATV